MTRTTHLRTFSIAKVRLFGFLAIALFLATTAHAAVNILTAGTNSDVTNYSSTGLDIGGFDAGNLGYWFANFAASAPVTGQPVDQNHANGLPSWLSVQFNPTPAATYSFATSATSTGGQPGYNVLTLPNGSSGLSGQLVDNLNSSGTASNTITTRWNFLAGTPSDFYLSVVLDNVGTGTPPDGPTTVQRLRASIFAADQTTNVQATYDNLAAGANNTADVYNFRLTGAEVGGFFSVQLRTSGNVGATADTGLAGFMFSGVPEPSSLALVLLGAAGFGPRRRRRT